VLFTLIFVGALVATVLFALGTMWLLDSRRSHVARGFALAADLALLAIGVALAREQQPDGLELTDFLLVSLFLGATLHGIGMIVWEGGGARLIRLLGSGLVAPAILLPSVVSLAVPLLAILVATSRRADGTVARQFPLRSPASGRR
jgi:hypothetical protein